jgi:hypothetical protein
VRVGEKSEGREVDIGTTGESIPLDGFDVLGVRVELLSASDDCITSLLRFGDEVPVVLSGA